MRFLVFAALVLVSPAAYAAPLASTRVIVLDAGHEPEEGLARPGAGGEKEFCLKIAAALKETVERENGQAVTVLVLSPADKDPRQREKAAAANQSGGSIYLAIHAAPAGTGKTRGLGVYSPEPGDAPATSWRAAARNFSEDNRRLNQKLKTALQALFPERRVFAAAAPLYLFHGVNMPSAAMETAADPGAPPKFFEDAGQALYDALVEYEKR